MNQVSENVNMWSFKRCDFKFSGVFVDLSLEKRFIFRLKYSIVLTYKHLGV